MSQKIKVSIIVPVYNVAPYLARCLDSLINQKLQDIEIICIDDKSTDNSLEILRQFQKKDVRIKVVTREKNAGAAAARNMGLDMARGEYIGFVDPDDYVDLDFYEKLYARATKNKSDIARANLQMTTCDQKKCILDGIINKVTHGKWYFFGEWVCAIYRAAILDKNNIRFAEDLICSEDSLFLARCVQCANCVETVPDTFYHYIRRNNSLDSHIVSPDKIVSVIKSYSMITDIYNNATDMPVQDYMVCYADVMGRLGVYYNRNTSAKCKRNIAECIVDLYKKCKFKAELMDALSFWDHETHLCLQSHDVDGMMESFNSKNDAESSVLAFPKTTKRKFYLFGVLPIIQIDDNVSCRIIRFCGLQLFKTKNTSNDWRMWFLYIPVVRQKIKK